jgi:hypothetical protein
LGFRSRTSRFRHLIAIIDEIALYISIFTIVNEFIIIVNVSHRIVGLTRSLRLWRIRIHIW